MATIKLIEEKAKAYDKALEKARQLCAYPTSKPFISDLQDLFPEIAESEDEKIRKALINGFNTFGKSAVWYNGITCVQILAWLEKQGEHANFRNKIQIGDKVTRNEDGVLVNLCQLKRVAKKDEKQGEQKPIKEHNACEFCEDRYGCVSPCPLKLIEEEKSADKVEPKFKVGDWVIGRATDNEPRQIAEIAEEGYKTTYGGWIGFSFEEDMRLWTIQDAKDGDVLITRKTQPFIFKNYDEDTDYVYAYCGISDLVKDNSFYIGNEDEPWTCCSCDDDVFPATKEQRDTLFAKMKEAGYNWDTEKKKLKNIKQTNWKPSDEQMKALKHASNDCSIAFADMKILATLYEQLKALHRYEQDT